MSKITRFAVAVVGGVAFGASAANAVSFSGTINLVGQFAAQTATGAGAPFATAAVVDFCASAFGACVLSPGGVGPGNTGALLALAATGSLGINANDTAVVKDLLISGFTPTLSPNVIDDFFVFGNGLAFDMTQLAVDRTPTVVMEPFLLITALGTLNLGTESAPAQFTFSAQGDSASANGTAFSFSARTLAPPGNGGGGTPIPMPAAFGVFGAGLLGLLLARRGRAA